MRRKSSTIFRARLQLWKHRSSFSKIRRSIRKTRPVDTKHYSVTVFLLMSISWRSRINSTTSKLISRKKSN